MEITFIILSLIFSVGMTLGVGASTFALAFFVAVHQEGQIDRLGRRFIRIVYTVLRIGMVFLGIALIGAFFIGFPPTAQYLMQGTLLLIITTNAVLMAFGVMPMRVGPIVAGGSWYALFFVTELPLSSFSYPALFGGYLSFLILFLLVFEIVKKLFAPVPASRAGVVS